MPYWQLFYHIVWSTKDRLPLLTPEAEPIIYGFLRGKAIGLGATLFALNGIADHVHMVAAIPPKSPPPNSSVRSKRLHLPGSTNPLSAQHPSFGKMNMASFLSTASNCRITSPTSNAKKSTTRKA